MIFECSTSDAVGQNIVTFIPIEELEDSEGVDEQNGSDIFDSIQHQTVGRSCCGKAFPIELAVSDVQLEERKVYTIIVRDVTERKDMERRLLQAQKLESIGNLAAGVAHEINTPIQYISNNVSFLQDEFSKIEIFIRTLDQAIHSFEEKEEHSEHERATLLIDSYGVSRNELDIDYLRSEIPKALDESLEGITRVSQIVQSMREFSHPGTEEKTAIDINSAIRSTATVSRNEWKYVAELELDLDDAIPVVPCFPGDFNQVILNLIVNAAHAIEDKLGGASSARGIIAIRTRCENNMLVISISDSGKGIPLDARSKIFDPFFTTKEVGKGTGQGLAICHSVIVDKHEGTIDFTTETDVGTTFYIRLPFESSRREVVAAPVLHA